MKVLGHELFHRERISQGAGGIRTAVRNEIRFHSLFGSTIKCPLKNSVPIIAVGNVDDFCSKQFIEQQICRWLFWLFACQDQNAFESKSSRRRGGLTTMIGLQCSA